MGFEGLYEVSSLGRLCRLPKKVRRFKNSSIILPAAVFKTSKDKDGYLRTQLRKDGIRLCVKVHRIVAMHFLPPSNKPEVNHKDCDKTNNAASNLEWATNKENIAHSVLNGRLIGRKTKKKLIPTA